MYGKSCVHTVILHISFTYIPFFHFIYRKTCYLGLRVIQPFTVVVPYQRNGARPVMWYCYPLLPQSHTLCSFVTKISLNQRRGIQAKFVLSRLNNAYRRSVGKAPLILNLFTRWRWVWVEHSSWECDSRLGGQKTSAFFCGTWSLIAMFT
jgi:hypothetical protein